MVVGKPYVHFKINNEPIEQVVDYNYTWATTVETDKGPVNTPVYISDASQAYSIFNVDMRPFFAQNPKSLIMVRVTSQSGVNGAKKEPSKGVYAFNTAKPLVFYRADQKEIEYEEGTEGTDDYVKYTFKVFYAKDNNGNYIPVIEHRNSNGMLIPESYIDSWHPNGNIVTEDEATAELKASNIYNANQVQPFLIPRKYILGVKTDTEGEAVKDDNGKVIPEPIPLFTVTSEYEGDYGISISCSKTIVGDGYTIVITDPSLGTLRMQNAYDINKIVNRINDKNLNLVATSTSAGDAITQAMHSYAQYVETKTVTVDGNAEDLIINDFIEGNFIALAVPKSEITIDSVTNEDVYTADSVTYLTKTDAAAIITDEKNKNAANYQPTASVKAIDYAINLESVGQQSLVGGSNGEWDPVAKRIPPQFQGDAHAEGLRLLQRIRLAGVFCMYGEDKIQKAYVDHGINPSEPEKGMNNNETCKWRTILLGANQYDRTDLASLTARATALNNQYILLLGQGLIDTGMNGYASTLSTAEKKILGLQNDHHLMPYECTQYIAGLRSKLDYGESIFGGQGRKRIRGVGTLSIAPLLDYETSYTWEPKNDIRLNEAGVLGFTEDYGNITLIDGVTTIQTGSEEDEEGVMNILKYAQNAIYDVCLPYIGRNIDADLENSITTGIEKVLETMKTTDQTLIDTEEYPAYDVHVALNSRRNQLLGRIYVYVTICPVHAVRQIEVEMTVQ